MLKNEKTCFRNIKQIKMKKIMFLVLCSLFLFPHFTTAQFISGFGVKAGVTASNFSHTFSNSLDLKTKFKTGLTASIFGEFINSKYFNLVVETGYDQRGYVMVIDRTDEFGNPLGEANYGFRTDYIFTGIGGKFKYKSSAVTPYLLLLPRVDFYLGWKFSPPDDWPAGQEYEEPVLEQFKKTMFGVGIGAGVEFNRLLPYKVFIEANYNPGLINSFGNSFVKVKEYSFNFKAGINFIKEKQKKSRK